MNLQCSSVWMLGAILLTAGIVCGCTGRPEVAEADQPGETGVDNQSIEAAAEEVKVVGISEVVKICRDSYGVPHILAENEGDAAFALGYAHAQDRFFQMDLLRRVWQGRQSEMFGPMKLEMDKLFRLLRTRSRMEAAWGQMRADDKQIFDRYAAGVNAALENRPSAIHALLKTTHEPWTAIDSLGIADLFNWQVSENLQTELLLMKIAAAAGPEKAHQLRPIYPAEGPFMIEPDELPQELRRQSLSLQSPELRNAQPRGPAFRAEPIRQVVAHLLAVSDACEKLPIGAGSNAWAVAPSRSATGKAFLAYDPHLSISAPSPWYHAHLKTSDSVAIGFTIPGLPLIVAGNNTLISFGFTVNNTDTQDLYIEEVNPQDPNSYKGRGEWAKMTVETETINVRGQKPVTFVTRWTAHGPVVSDLTPKARSAMSLHWTAWEADPGKTVAGFRGMTKAKSWDEWRRAAMLLEDSPKNFVYADREGNIGCMVTGRLPLRKPAAGDFPVSGADGQHEWTGYVPPGELPYSFNPPKGFVASANEKSWPSEYKYDEHLNGRWAHPYRQMRIQETMAEKTHVGCADMKAMQLDTKSTLAPLFLEMALPALKKSQDPETLWAASVLADWDFRMETKQIAPTLYHALYIKAAWNVFVDDFGEELTTEYRNDQYLFQERLRTILETSEPELRDGLFRRSMKDALQMIKMKQGENREQWTWGEMHTVQWTAVPAVVLPALSGRFTFPVEPIGVDGGPDTLWRAKYLMDDPFKVSQFIASSRLIVDWSTPESSWAVNATGQSEDPDSGHQFDLSRLWLRGEYYPLISDMERLKEMGVTTLVLVP